ncbi:HNH endonuclease signature motif containing protein [Cryptosporangium phraense]|nr:HNH endonuclease signature motif containing protein [Cryptosporangium phraense]
MPDYPDLAEIADLPPGPELAFALVAVHPRKRSRGVAATELPEVLPDIAGQVVIAKCWQRLAAWVDSQMNAAILDIAGREPVGNGLHGSNDEDDWGREEVSAALRMSAQGAAERIDVARVLATRRFQTGRALEEGQITYRHAVEIVKGLEPLEDDEAAEEAERRLLDSARKKTPAQTGTRARREVIKADPDGAERRRRRARTGRRVDFFPLPDAMTEIRAFVPAEGASRVRATLDRLAGRSRVKGDKRTIDQRRADAFVALAELGRLAVDHPMWRGEDRPETPSEEGGPDPLAQQWATAVAGIVMGKRAAAPRVALVAPLSTVLGATHEPGNLTGYGPVPPAVARELAGDGQWERWLADRRGVVTDVGRAVYRPPAPLAALIRAIYPTCMFPGCSQPSYRCDLDHNVRRVDGGTTDPDNLVPLCRRHHRAKDEGGWRVDHDADRKVCTWTSPAGHVYTVEAPTHSLDEDDDLPVDVADREAPLMTMSDGADGAGAEAAAGAAAGPAAGAAAASDPDEPPPF